MPDWFALLAAGALGFGLGVGLVSAALVIRWLRRVEGPLAPPGPSPSHTRDYPSGPGPEDIPPGPDA